MIGQLSQTKGDWNIQQEVYQLYVGRLSNFQITDLIIYMKKFLHFDWLRAVQFLGNTAPKKEIQGQKKKFRARKRNSVQISLGFKFLNFLTTRVYF